MSFDPHCFLLQLLLGRGDLNQFELQTRNIHELQW